MFNHQPGMGTEGPNRHQSLYLGQMRAREHSALTSARGRHRQVGLVSVGAAWATEYILN